MRRASTVALVALALGAAGCGGGDEEGAGETDETTEPSTPAGTPLKGTVGPGYVITLTTADGGPLGTLAPGTYELEVEDLSDIHNFHLTGPGGVEIATDVGEEGVKTFEVELQPGTYTFRCDPHATSMRGSFDVG